VNSEEEKWPTNNLRMVDRRWSVVDGQWKWVENCKRNRKLPTQNSSLFTANYTLLN